MLSTPSSQFPGRRMMLFISTALLLQTSSVWAQQAASEPVPPEPPNMVEIFNGKDLTGWAGHPGVWSVQDGVIRGSRSGLSATQRTGISSNTFLIWEGGEPADFELRLSARLHRGSNSGIQIRSRHLKDYQPEEKHRERYADNRWVVSGYQVEMTNRQPEHAAMLYEELGRSKLCLPGNRVVRQSGREQTTTPLDNYEQALKAYHCDLSENPPWNEFVIVAQKDRIRVWVNGIQTVDFVDQEIDRRAESGVIALQLHTQMSWVEFKDLRIKLLGKNP